MRRTLVAANWKMNKTIAEAEAFAAALRDRVREGLPCDLVVCPPFLALPFVARTLQDSGVDVGAQDLYWEAEGAFTGEVSAAMIADAGARYVIVGHSERRHVMGEDDATVARKLRAALSGGMTPILCVGERIEAREADRHEEVVDRQLAAALEGWSEREVQGLVVAYEPVWAIGTGRTASPDDAEAMHRFVRSRVRDRFGDGAAGALRIQYGGSVKPDNAAALLAREDIDGALVGGASLEVESFLAIARAAGA